jgi:hypothetical protein
MNNGVFVSFSRIFLLGILIFKGLIARHLYKLFGIKGLNYQVKTLILYNPLQNFRNNDHICMQ